MAIDQLAVAILQLNLRNIEPLTLQHLIFTLTQSKPIHLFPQFAKRSYPTEIQRIFVAAVINRHAETIKRVYDDCATADELQGKASGSCTATY